MEEELIKSILQKIIDYTWFDLQEDGRLVIDGVVFLEEDKTRLVREMFLQ